MKPKRKTDRGLLAAVRGRPCVVCGHRKTESHHVKTRGSGGDDSPDNVVPLCRIHHQEVHAIGRLTFAQKYELGWFE